MGRDNRKKSDGLNRRQRPFFYVLLFMSPVFIIVFLELFLRIVGYGDNYKLFINHPNNAYHEYKIVNPEIGKKYFCKYEPSHPANDIFLKNKPDDIFRIFVMGSSTVAGFPYGNNLMFSRILYKRLKELYPNKKIEIINTAINAINSFSLLDFVPQILNEDPDAILFYAGHDEFYGAFGVGSNETVFTKPWLISWHFKLMKFRLYQFIQHIISTNNESISNRKTLVSKLIKNDEITFGSKVYKKGIENYEKNLDRILAISSKKGIPVYISNVVSNLSGIRPFNSIETKEFKGAEEFFMNARSDEGHGDITLAYENYTKARDYDCIRLRASSDINAIIEKTAKKYHAVLVPTLQLFERNSRSGIIGTNLITDHVHPNVKGQFLLAESFFEALVKSKSIAEDGNINKSKPLNYFIGNYGYSYLDLDIAKHRVNNLMFCWPFKDDATELNDYISNYKPSSMIDSLAFFAFEKNDEALQKAHKFLAKHYEESGDLINAFKEYDAMLQTNPYQSDYYWNAANCLLEMSDLNGALEYYEESNEFSKTFYAHFKAGEIRLIKNDFENAIAHFIEARNLVDEADKMDLLVKLYISYIYASDNENATTILNEINKIDPDIKVNIPARRFQFSRYVPMQVQLQIDDADEFLARENIEAAELSLLNSLRIYDTAIANKKLGDIYFNKNEYDKSLLYFQKIYDDYKGDVTYLNNLIITYIKNAKKDEAKMVLRQLKKVDSNYIGYVKLQSYIDDFSL